MAQLASVGRSPPGDTKPGGFWAGSQALRSRTVTGIRRAPGTAVALAESLGLKPDAIASERDPSRQKDLLAVPREHLARHAVHRIRISDGVCTVNLESRVMGEAPYARGVGQLLRALQTRTLELRLYRVEELINAGWL